MNTLQDAKDIITGLMSHHGYGDIPFRFTKGTTTLAQVKWQWFRHTGESKVCELGFSKKWAMALPEDELREVVLHELAHIDVALTYGKGPKPHGPEFRSAIRELGGRLSKACHQPSVDINGNPVTPDSLLQ